MKKIFSSLVLAGALLLSSNSAQADFTMKLGSVDDVTRWFSYPNNCSVICYKDWTLEETAEHYLNQSLTRDGYSGIVSVTIQDYYNVNASYTGNMPDNYQNAVTTLLQTGTKAFEAAVKINEDKKWDYSWYFFLPQGMALYNHKSLEFLHFPPDYSLTESSDYLDSKTTDRWNTMLEINGVATSETPLYQTVLDLAPIAAPASAGSTLTNTYSYFEDYDMDMLQNWTTNPAGQVLPVVAFGSPVRSWIESQFGVYLKVNGVAYIKLPNGASVPFMGSNHPSYIWYAGNTQGCDDTPEKAYERGTAVMLQDAIASCWQSSMGENPSQDANTVAATCTAQWNAKPKEICEMYYEQVQNKTPSEAAELCKGVSDPINTIALESFQSNAATQHITRHADPEELSAQ